MNGVEQKSTVDTYKYQENIPDREQFTLISNIYLEKIRALESSKRRHRVRIEEVRKCNTELSSTIETLTNTYMSQQKQLEKGAEDTKNLENRLIETEDQLQEFTKNQLSKAQDTEKKIAELDRKIKESQEQMQKQIQEQQNQINALKNANTSLQKEASELTVSHTSLSSRVNSAASLSSSIQQLSTTVGSLQEQSSNNNRRIGMLEGFMAKFSGVK